MNDVQNDKPECCRHGKKIFLALLLLIAVAVLLFVLKPCLCGRGCKDGHKDHKGQCGDCKVEKTDGQRFEFSPFYHATEGDWTIEDSEIFVLTEKKYISDSERDRYVKHTITSADRVRIVESDARWKKVEIIRDAKVQQTGWVDAHRARTASRLETLNLKAPKQQYPH